MNNMNEDFGAHRNEFISTHHEPMQRSEKAFCWILVAIAAVVVALFKTGVIK